PKILLMDEPLSNLDAKLRHQLRGQLKELQTRFGITTVYVTHDQDEALTLSDRIAVLNKGRVEQVGTPEEVYDRSATEFVCTFVGDSSRLTAEFVRHLNAAGAAIPEGVSYLRTEKVSLVPVPGARATVEGVVRRRTYHGMHSTYTVEAHGAQVKVVQKEDGAPRRQPGEKVTLYLDPAHVLTYPKDTSTAADSEQAVAS